MSTWGEVTGLDGPSEFDGLWAPGAADEEAPALPVPPVDVNASHPAENERAGASSSRVAAYAVKGNQIVYTGDGPQPPPPVRRLRYVEEDHSPDVVRTHRGAWRWQVRDLPTSTAVNQPGWSWDNVRVRYPKQWVVVEVDGVPEEPVRHPRSEEPGPEVLRIQPYDENDRQVTSCPPFTQLVRLGKGWWWVRDNALKPSRGTGWPWSSNHLDDVAYWVDITTDEDRASGAPDERLSVYRFSGPEPPPHIVRLAAVHDSAKVLIRRPAGGWWTVDDPRAVPATEEGWSWDPPSRGHEDVSWRPLYPVVNHHDSDDDELIRDLALCLPDDGEWYRIGTDRPTGQPLLARHNDDDDDEDDEDDGYDTSVGD